jgi:Chain length determinant protein
MIPGKPGEGLSGAKSLRIKQITEALKNAEAAKITTPQIQQTQDVTQETMFLLGSEALKSMIDNEASRPLVFSGAYYQTNKTCWTSRI